MKLTLAENIRAFRKERRLTQEQFAGAMGVTIGSVYKWETGQTIPELSVLVEIADFFGVSLDYLFDHKTTGVMISKEDADRLLDLKTVIESIDKKMK